MATKKRTTMSKMNRERELREKRERKKERKDQKKLAAVTAAAIEAEGPPAEDGDEPSDEPAEL
jgi:Na+-transporting methylmalonyl-CoA/oxaloacetate decarboxylase gamma subunit